MIESLETSSTPLLMSSLSVADGNQYVTIPLSSSVASYIKGKTVAGNPSPAPKSDKSAEKILSIKQEYD